MSSLQHDDALALCDKCKIREREVFRRHDRASKGYSSNRSPLNRVISFSSSDMIKNAPTCPSCSLILEGCQSLIVEIQPSHHSSFSLEVQVNKYMRAISATISHKTVLFHGRKGNLNPWSLLFAENPSFNTTGSERTISLALKWLSDCVNHKVCASQSDQPLPTRILEIGKKPSNAITLREPLNQSGRYVCLSYCWGGPSFISTTRENIANHKKGIPWEALPKTFQDAIQVVRRLRVEYIWIDALCIIQDDFQDWEKEAGNMATIYQNSFITIAATAARSPLAGLFSISSKVELHSINAQLIHHFPNSAADDREETCPLLSRAWTYQERMLAPRPLFFGRDEISWECLEGRRCECGIGESYLRDEIEKPRFFSTLGQSAGENDARVAQDRKKRLWRNAIIQYSPLSLTFASDKLPALSGLAEHWRRSTNWTYLAGLWKENLELDLLWYREAWWEKNFSPEVAAWRAPSWSWASIDDPIMYEQKLYLHGESVNHTFYFRILKADCTLMGQSLTGQVTAGYVELACSIAPVSYSSADGRVKYDSQWTLFYPDREAEGEGYLIRMVKLSHGSELLLVVTPSEAGPKTYTRVGVASFVAKESQLLPWSEETTVRII